MFRIFQMLAIFFINIHTRSKSQILFFGTSSQTVFETKAKKTGSVKRK